MSVRIRLAAFALGALACAGAIVAYAAIFGAQSVADLVGTEGTTMTMAGYTPYYPGETEPEIEQGIDVFISRDDSTSPVGLTGTVDYRAMRGPAWNHIYRFKYEVKDPDGSWTTVLLVTEPDVRITNPQSGAFNTFSSTYQHADMARGMSARATIWSSAIDTHPMVFSMGAEVPAE